MNRIKSIALAAMALLASIQPVLSNSIDSVAVATNNGVQHRWHHLGDNSFDRQPVNSKVVECDVAVIGGGMSGICAAVAAARQGADVVLVNDRPVLGGNASSEIRVTVNGFRAERETGVLEEILLENRKYNPQDSYPVWDHVLFDYVTRQENLTLMLNTSALYAEMDGDKIASAVCWQGTTATTVKINAPIFIDCTGDGALAASAGAEYRTGREGKEEFGETFAPDEPDGWVMGESVMLITKDMGYPVEFYPPSCTIKYDAEKAHDRKITCLKEGYWWVELGSKEDIIEEREQTRDNLIGYMYGVWDYIKNSGDFPKSSNLALEWVGSLPGKRESRRFEGDYMLKEGDMVNHVIFDDAVAYGGWSLDEHCPGGITALDQRPSYFHHFFKKPYQVPYRCLYSRNIDNLFFAGRNASVSHIALSSTRIIGTCSMMGQAVGVASAMCIEKGVEPRDIYEHSIKELQERMLRADYYIPYRPATDEGNLVKSAKSFTASSTISGDVKNLLDGVARDEVGEVHHWMSDGLNAYLNVEWKRPVELSSVEIKFDTNLQREINMYKNPEKKIAQVMGMPPELVKAFTVEAKVDGEWKLLADVDNNITRYVPVEFDTVSTKELRIRLKDTYGDPNIKVFELRCY